MSLKHGDPGLRENFTRRQFLYTTALAAGGLAISGCAAPARRRVSPNEKLNIGFVGVGGKGDSDVDCCASENIVALCDVDARTLAKKREKYPNARTYKDWRVMLEKEKSLDAIVISTPDHTHGVIAATAIRMGKHVYCQKPLTQTVYEARLLQKLAKQYGVATQMGNQGGAEDGLRRAIEVIQAGVIGQVRQVHVWTNRPIWPQGMDRPEGEDPVPDYLDWDLWLGPAPWRPYKHQWPENRGGRRRASGAVYHPFVWRGWQDFGTGALGDMACHTAHLPFRALRLGYPTVVEAESSPMNRESWPLKSRVRFEFPAREGLAPVTLWWYDGGNPKPDNPYAHDGSNKPPREITADIEEMTGQVSASGCVLIGDKGRIYSGNDYGAAFHIRLNDDKEMVAAEKHEAVRAIPQRLARNPHSGGSDLRHHLEWIAACKGGPACFSDFAYAGLLTEIILLGCVALQVGRRLEWDGPNLRATNAPEAERFIRRPNRKGWSL